MYIWPHTYYNGKNKKLQKRELEPILKNYLSSDCILKLKYMKLKSLVIADHKAAVNEKSGFAHTAHHAREILTARSLRGLYLSQDLESI